MKGSPRSQPQGWCGCKAAFHPHTLGQGGVGHDRFLRHLCHPLQIDVVALENVDDLRVKPGSGLLFHLFHGFGQRQGGTVLSVGGQGIQTIHGGQNARANGNLLAGESTGDGDK